MGVTVRAEPLRVGVLASGRGSNLQALLDATRAPGFPARIAVVIADRERAAALQRAASAGVPAVFVDPKAYGDREAYDAALLAGLERQRVDLVCLAGFMRILGGDFVRRLRGRLVNIHPSLLPAFPGLHATRQALDHGVKIAGVTVHFVDEGVDTGPIIAQASVPVRDDDTEASLSERILVEEHRLYPDVVRRFAEGRLRLSGRRVITS
jgi:phosphoribosylglycinamide formyltransferase-1